MLKTLTTLALTLTVASSGFAADVPDNRRGVGEGEGEGTNPTLPCCRRGAGSFKAISLSKEEPTLAGSGRSGEEKK